MLEKLKAQLKEIFKDYDSNYVIANDQDIAKFENMIIDYDNENNTDYYSSLLEVVQVADFDIIEDVIKSNCSSVADLANLINDVEDSDAEFFKFDDYCTLSNVYLIDLIDWVNDYLK